MSLYPDIEPYQYCYLPVSDGHELYVEQVGNPKGIPILFLHGGPGGRSWPWDRRLFNPKKFRVILYHQRGGGFSKPTGSLEANTTLHLLDDIEHIRQHFGIKRWHLFGGSWGTTLALLYAQQYPQQVSSLILRGVFLSRPQDIDWLYQSGALWNSPHYYKAFTEIIPENERSNLVAAYYKRLCQCDDLQLQKMAAEAWFNWEIRLCQLISSDTSLACNIDPQEVLNVARIEAHYFYHQGFVTEDYAILNPKRLDRLKNIPIYIAQGRYDMVCPPMGAWLLKESLSKVNLNIVADAGHSQDEPNLLSATIAFLDQL